ncbi:MAG: hypothetical protein ACXVKK_02650 [Flavisolibacter sp.]
MIQKTVRQSLAKAELRLPMWCERKNRPSFLDESNEAATVSFVYSTNVSELMYFQLLSLSQVGWKAMFIVSASPLFPPGFMTAAV